MQQHSLWREWLCGSDVRLVDLTCIDSSQCGVDDVGNGCLCILVAHSGYTGAALCYIRHFLACLQDVQEPIHNHGQTLHAEKESVSAVQGGMHEHAVMMQGEKPDPWPGIMQHSMT